MSSVKFLRELAGELERAPRIGAETDVPEGSRYITISDTLACRIAGRLRKAADTCEARGEVSQPAVMLTGDRDW